MVDENKWGSMPDAAAVLGVSVKTIRRRIADGSIKARRFGPRSIRVDMSSLERWGRPVTSRHDYKWVEHD